MENQPPITDLFSKYLENQCTPEEIKLLRAYFSNPGNEEMLRSLIHSELHKDTLNNTLESDEGVIGRVRQRLVLAVEEGHRNNCKAFNIPRWIKIAAFWFLLLGAGAYLIGHYLDLIKATFNPLKNFTLTTKPGERKYIVLADGSKIWLSPSSSFSYPDQFNGNLREVKLEGEAFFQIAKDKKHPFIIHTGDMSTRVVGTSFEIDAYKTQQHFMVTVVTGVVRVYLPKLNGVAKQEVVLKPYQRVTYNKTNGKLAASACPEANQTLLKKTGIINSRSMTLGELINELSEYYNTPIELLDIPANSVCYGDFDTNKPLAVLLRQIAFSINGDITFSKNKYIISGKGE